MIFSFASDVIRVINARRMRWPGHVARVGEDRNAWVVPKSQAKRARGRPRSKLEGNTRAGTLIVATIYLQLIQNRYMFRSFTVLQCSHQHCVQPLASDVEVVGYL